MKMRIPSTHSRARQEIGFVAVVHTVDSVSFATTAGTRSALIERIAEYVWDVAAERLTPHSAKEVRRFLGKGQLERGIDCYFTCVGERWDDEWLVTAAIGNGALPTAFALVDRVVPETGGVAAVA
jgi:hypothetical protein